MDLTTTPKPQNHTIPFAYREGFTKGINPTRKMAEEGEGEKGPQEDRRIVVIGIKPCAGVDPQELYEKIKETVTSQPEYKLKWDETCNVYPDGKIQATFTIHIDADFDEEVMDVLEMMEGEVAKTEITYQSAME
jgi:hypothetical protein